ncbi:chromate efflux transporter [Aestuariivirga litoralis]|uniref:chromate efflux transporter n=1 Tax=Aestuariivirga litoralis TaxID=2650924 RepID=UPI0018C48BA0|nr:chromate efflux transporter [Aestuariivirga litoralis]MBG1233140.1 chromate efflux transporter [Aestuariivirga litoralis]
MTFPEMMRLWLRIGCLSFGGPAGQIALMHREVIEKRELVSEKEFLSALNFCMFIPGPEAQQLAIYLGWRSHGMWGGLAAGLLFVLPGAVVMFALATLYALFGHVPLVNALFWGIKAAVLAIVLEALVRVAKRALKSHADYVVAALAFVAIFGFNVPFPLVVILAAASGFLMADEVPGKKVALPDPRPVARQAMIWTFVWLAPLAVLNLAAADGVFAGLGNFFARLAVVTFGGAYAMLSYMGQAVVDQHHWLTAGQMIDGLGLAETTPGPLILVGQFVGFLAAAKAQGTIWAGLLGGLIFLWMSFAPCFLWVFVGAPYLAYIQSNPRLAKALSRVTAAVVGVILNLSLWFGLHVIFGSVARAQGPVPIWWPDFSTIDTPALILTILAALALLHAKWGMTRTLAFAATLGIIWKSVIPLL